MILVKGKDESGQVLFKSKKGNKLSGMGKEAYEELRIDRMHPEFTTKDHIVREQQPNGTWAIVHEEHQTFKAKRRIKGPTEV